MGVCNCSMFCCTLLYVHSSIAIILMGKREMVALLNLSSWCLVMVEQLFLPVPRGCLQFVIVIFPDHTHYFLSPPVKHFTDRSKVVLLLRIFYVFFCLSFAMPLCASVYMCLVVTCWERADPLALIWGV